MSFFVQLGMVDSFVLDLFPHQQECENKLATWRTFPSASELIRGSQFSHRKFPSLQGLPRAPLSSTTNLLLIFLEPSLFPHPGPSQERSLSRYSSNWTSWPQAPHRSPRTSHSFYSGSKTITQPALLLSRDSGEKVNLMKNPVHSPETSILPSWLPKRPRAFWGMVLLDPVSDAAVYIPWRGLLVRWC